jgi:hypothetical protein
MSILFLPPQSAGSVTIADATETTSGKIRIATSAEATAGTNDVTAMTPAKVKSVVDASLVGGVTYQGTFDASAPADLSNANKGDLYIISVAGTYAGKTWAVGDHLLINADMGGTLDSAKIDKVDNTDAVTSVAGRTGAVTLSTADISGLATVASTGAYSDLSGTPTLGTAATEDVGTGAGNVVQLDGTGKLPAVDGSQLTNLPASSMALNDLTDVTFTAGSGIDNFVLTYNNGTGLWGAEIRKSFYLQPYGTTATAAQISDNRSMYYELTASGITLTIPTPSGYAGGGLVIVRNTSAGASSITGPSMMLSDGSVVSTLSLDADDVKIFVWRSIFPTATLHEISTSRLSQIDDVDLTGLANGDVLVYNSTSGKWQAGSAPATSLALDDLTDVNITSASTGEVLRYDGAEWVDAQLAYSDLSGTPTLGTAAALDVGTSAGNVVQIDGTGKLPAIDGSQLTNLPSGDSFYRAGVSTTSTASVISDNRRQHYDILNGGVTLTLPQGGSTSVVGGVVSVRNASTANVTFGGTTGVGPVFKTSLNTNVYTMTIAPGETRSFVWNGTNALNEVSVSQLSMLGDVTITGASTGEVLRYDGSEWVDAQLAYSDLSGAPTNVSTFTNDAGYISDITAENLGDLADVDLTGLADGEIIVYNATSGKWEANPPPAPLATTTSVGLIEIAENVEATAGTATDKALVPSNISSITTAQLDNSAGTMLESANNLSDLANAATARTNLGLATVASTGAYSDLSGTPTLGTAAALDVGTAANNVVQLNGSAQLPAVDGSLLTGVTADLSGATLDDLSDVAYPSAPTDGQILKWVAANNRWEPADTTVSFTTATPGSTYIISTHIGSEEVHVLTPSVDCTVSLPTAATCGKGFKYVIKNMSTNEVTVSATIDGGSSFLMNIQYSTLTLVSDGVSSFYVI